VVEDVLTPFRYTGWFTDAETDLTLTGDVTGTVQSRVVRSVDATYDLYWRITVDETAFLPVLTFSLTGLEPATYNANWRLDGPGSVSPAAVAQSRSGDVQWAFGRYIAPSTQIHQGEQTRFLFLDTGARGYSRTAFFSLASGRDSGGSMMIQWGGASGPYPTFAPTPVPEPSSGWLALCGVAVLAFAGRRMRTRVTRNETRCGTIPKPCATRSRRPHARPCRVRPGSAA
jgi:hypothetical protein